MSGNTNLKLAKQDNWVTKDGLVVLYNGEFYTAKAKNKKLQNIKEKFNNLRNNFIDNLKNLKSFELDKDQLLIDDIRTLEYYINKIKDDYLEKTGDLIEEFIEKN